MRSHGLPVRRRRAGAAGSGAHASTGEEEPRQDEERRDDRDGLAVPVLHGQRLAAARTVALGVGEVLRRSGARGERARRSQPIAHGSAENADATSVQPATLRRHPRGNRDRHVRPHPEPLRPPEGRARVDERRDEAGEEEKEALVIGERGGGPRRGARETPARRSTRSERSRGRRASVVEAPRRRAGRPRRSRAAGRAC